MGLELGATIALAQRLQPDAQRVFVVTGTSENDSFYERIARSQLDPFTKNLEFTYLSGLRVEALEQRLATLPPRSIVYYLPFTRDSAGRNFLRPRDLIASPPPPVRRCTASWSCGWIAAWSAAACSA